MISTIEEILGRIVTQKVVQLFVGQGSLKDSKIYWVFWKGITFFLFFKVK